MSYKNLKKFVQQQAIRGEDPVKLKEGLLLNGWDRAHVDRAISEVYGFKRKVLKISLFVIVSLIVVLSVSLLLIFGDLYDDPSQNVPSPINQSLSEDFSNKPCSSFDDASLKDECYLEKVKDGFECDGLSGEELFFCNRVLEFTILMD